MYALGIDLGTTFTAAATWRNGHVEFNSLGTHASAIPSVVLLREDETVLTGETASRRGQTEPHRVAREFKRRLGDTTPILLGGVPYSADALMGKLLKSVVEQVSAREGGPPATVSVTHPANWGPYKMDLLNQAVRQSGLEQPVTFVSEPEAAAVYYAHQQRIAPGAIVAVYDLGGGTFDAAVLRKTDTGFQILGQPEGIERLGGIDFDAAVFEHVSRAIDGKLAELDEEDPAAIAAVARLKDECVQAKEALSSDTDASIPVLLPNVATEVRITRAEFEAMVRPVLHTSIEALNRALRSAQVSAEQLHSVLLVGGSSRMPVVAQLLGAELGRPVTVDAHPKFAVSGGAAWVAAAKLPGFAAPAAQSAAGSTPAPQAPMPRATASMPPPAAPAAPAPSAAAPVPPTPASVPPATPTTQVMPAVATGARATPAAPATPTTYGSAAVGSAPPEPPKPPAEKSGSRKGLLVGAGALVVALVAAGGVALAMSQGDDDPGGDRKNVAATPTGESSPDANAGESSPPTDTAPPLPADEQCTDEIKANDRWVCLTRAVWDGSQLTIEYEAEWAGGKPNTNGGYHLHVYGSDGTAPAGEVMGVHAPQGSRGHWYVTADDPVVLNATQYEDVIGGAPKACARISDSGHRLVKDRNGGYQTGNCVPIEQP